jgi:hypothetical protein
VFLVLVTMAMGSACGGPRQRELADAARHNVSEIEAALDCTACGPTASSRGAPAGVPTRELGAVTLGWQDGLSHPATVVVAVPDAGPECTLAPMSGGVFHSLVVFEHPGYVGVSIRYSDVDWNSFRDNTYTFNREQFTTTCDIGIIHRPRVIVVPGELDDRIVLDATCSCSRHTLSAVETSRTLARIGGRPNVAALIGWLPTGARQTLPTGTPAP